MTAGIRTESLTKRFENGGHRAPRCLDHDRSRGVCGAHREERERQEHPHEHPGGGLMLRPVDPVYFDDERIEYTDRKRLIHLRRNEVGFVFQQFNLVPTISAIENVAYPLLFNYTPREERDQRALRLLTLVGLADRADHLPHELSGGEQQRVAIARALVGSPHIVLRR